MDGGAAKDASTGGRLPPTSSTASAAGYGLLSYSQGIPIAAVADLPVKDEIVSGEDDKRDKDTSDREKSSSPKPTKKKMLHSQAEAIRPRGEGIAAE